MVGWDYFHKMAHSGCLAGLAAYRVKDAGPEA
jgi:hypothetical protein